MVLVSSRQRSPSRFSLEPWMMATSSIQLYYLHIALPSPVVSPGRCVDQLPVAVLLLEKSSGKEEPWNIVTVRANTGRCDIASCTFGAEGSKKLSLWAVIGRHACPSFRDSSGSGDWTAGLADAWNTQFHVFLDHHLFSVSAACNSSVSAPNVITYPDQTLTVGVMADAHLYGVKKTSKTKTREISSSTSLAFSSSLASLITSSSSKTSSSGRARPSKSKAGIFTAHNKNVKKRAAADMLDDGEQRHQTRDDIGSVDSADLQRSRRRMEEKVRLYNAMKRGDHGKHGRSEDGGLVDFDRKWAESQGAGRRDSDSDSATSEDEAQDNSEMIEYVDEFGRLRKGTKAEAEREERRKRIQATAKKEVDDSAARPSMPSNVIYGDTVQHHAFNPDQVIADRMAEIAKKRDRSATPPPDTHFDANAEVRTKGTGFYNFSHDSEERKKQMDALEKERLETERVRGEREAKKQQRKKEIEERKKLIAEQRSKAQADKFLNDFDLESG